MTLRRLAEVTNNPSSDVIVLDDNSFDSPSGKLILPYTGLGIGSPMVSLSIPSMRLDAFTSFLLGSSDTVVFTCPPGKRLIPDLKVSNYTAGAITFNTALVLADGVTQFTTAIGLSAAANAAGAGTGLTNIMNPFSGIPMLEPGESYKITSLSGAGLTAFVGAYLMDIAEPVRTIRNYNLVAGDNVIYTCPAGKRALIYSSSGNVSRMAVVNQSGGSVTFTMYIVRNGQTKGTNNQLLSNFAVANNTSNSASFSPTTALTFGPGDSLVVNCSAGPGGNTMQYYIHYLIEFNL